MGRTRIRNRHRPPGSGGDKRWFGLILLFVGSFILLKKFDLFYFDFRSMWPWALIVIGVLIGIKNKFRNNAPYILIAVGAAHLIPVFEVFGVSSKALVLPAALIAIGLILILKPHRKKKLWNERCEDNIKTVTNNDNLLNIDVTFGGHKEIVTSKEFKGGKISTTFGGTEINLMNADSSEKLIYLDFKVSFGGVEIVVPSHWQIQNDISNTLGSVEDNRNIYTNSGASDEQTITLVLRGSCSFGSIEIKSY